MVHPNDYRRAFTLIELLVVIAIIAILSVVVILSLNPAELLRQSRDSDRLSDMATIADGLNVYSTDQAGGTSFNLGNASDTYPSVYDPSATSTSGDQCQGLGMASFTTSTGQSWQCAPSSTLRTVNNQGWIPVNFSNISSGSPIGNLPIDATNQTSTGLFYAYNTNGAQFEVTADLESQKYKGQYGSSPQTSLFPEVISGGNPTISALYNPSGLVGYWNFEEGSGSSVIDSSGNGNHGTWKGSSGGNNGTHYVGGKVGSYAGAFNGRNNYVNIGNVSSLSFERTNPFSVCAWESMTGVNEAIVGKLDAKSPYLGWELSSDSNGHLEMVIENAYTTNAIWVYASGTNSAINTGAWFFVCGTYNGSSDASGTALYINGSSATTTIGSNNLTLSILNAIPVQIGARVTDAWLVTGSLDDVRVYNRGLSSAEVMALYNAEK